VGMAAVRRERKDEGERLKEKGLMESVKTFPIGYSITDVKCPSSKFQKCHRETFPIGYSITDVKCTSSKFQKCHRVYLSHQLLKYLM
jgi:hypothetical protein